MNGRWNSVVLWSVVLLCLAGDWAYGQTNRRGYSTRGISPAGARTSSLRSPVITGSRSSYNAAFGANMRGPLGFNYIPNGFYFDMGSPYNYSGDVSAQSGVGAQGEDAQGESSSRTTRPNIRPRLNLADRDATNSMRIFQSIRKSLAERTSAAAEKPFSTEWYSAHPEVTPVKLIGGDPWRRANWDRASQLIGIQKKPHRFDYRPDNMGLIYVHRDDSMQERAVDARGPAMDLASNFKSLANESPALSLGVFATVPPVDEPVTILLHLALSESGAVSGHQYDFTTDSMEPLTGALDPSSQRLAWKVGNNHAEAGLKNLTEDVSRFILFREDGWTQPWILMRMEEKQQSPANED